MQYEIGRGGYFPATSSTTESQSLTIRGLLRAYQATGVTYYLTLAKTYTTALIKYFFFDTPPPSTGIWPTQWIVNAGDPFPVKGPLHVSGNPSYSGNIENTVYFTNGVANLGTDLATVYNASTPDSSVLWHCVFSGLSTGSKVNIYCFWDAYGYKQTGVNNDHTGTSGFGWGEKIGENTVFAPPDVSKAGQIELMDSGYTGDLHVTHSNFLNTLIPYSANFECWPMWRVLGRGEWNFAGDTIHWILDVFNLLVVLDTGSDNAKWVTAKNAILRMWSKAMEFDTSTYFFQGSSADIGTQWNTFPMVFYFVTIGYTGIQSSDPSIYTDVSRDSAGHVRAYFPTNGDGFNFFIFENDSLFITVPSTSNHFNIGAGAVETSDSTELRFFITTSDNHVYQYLTFLDTGAPHTNLSIPLENFTSLYTYGRDVVSETATGFTLTLNPDSGSSGTGMAGYWPLDTAPTTLNILNNTVSSTDGRLIMTVKCEGDGKGVVHQKYIYGSSSVQAIPTTTGWRQDVWNDSETAHSLTSTITEFQWFCAWWGGATVALEAFSGCPMKSANMSVRKVSIRFLSNRAITIGDGYFTIGSRDSIAYTPGALPFQISNNSIRSGNNFTTSANFQGPFYIGYQNPNPYIALNEAAKARNMMQLIVDSQNHYTSVRSTAGPFTPVYLPSTWDSLMFSHDSTEGFTWEGPDSNTFWGGFQYRPFAAVSEFAYNTIGLSGIDWTTAHTLAMASSLSFITWLDSWLIINSDSTDIPTSFPETSTPLVTYREPHMIAVALQGALWSRKAGINLSLCNRVIDKLYAMLKAYNIVSDGIGMDGAFTPDPDPSNGVFYGYWGGEILTVLSLHAILK